MKFRPTFTTGAAAGAIGSLLMAASIAAGASDPAAKSLALRRIMREMGQNMQIITDGISREDWELVGKTAPLIADHPQPPLTEKARILGFVGTDAGQFKGHDKNTRLAARELGQAAVRQDGLAVISAFARMQISCLACHQSFRRPFQEHFYGVRRR